MMKVSTPAICVGSVGFRTAGGDARKAYRFVASGWTAKLCEIRVAA